MILYDPSKTLISVHVPKTGGTSFRKILSSWFGENFFLHYFDEPNKKMPAKAALTPGLCIHGHFNSRRGFGIRHYYPDVVQFITFLRDPFEIMVSFYYYVKLREMEGSSFRDGKPTNLAGNVNDFLSKEIYNPEYTPNVLDFFPDTLTSGNYKEMIRSKFIFIGFMDQYQPSLDRLADLLGFPRITAPFENKSERFGEVDPILHKAFINHHPLEYEVYNYARSRYLNQ